MLHHQSLLYVPKLIKTELISRNHNDLLAGHFGIEKTWELVARKYYWKILSHNIKNYIKKCNVCLACKFVRHKSYSLQSLLVLTHWWKDLSMDFVTGLPISTDKKGNSYNSIFVVVNRLTKMVHYKLVQTTINTPRMAKVIMNVIVQHHGLFNLIVSN